MAKKTTVAQDSRTIRKVRKVLRSNAPVVHISPLDPSVERDRWLAKHHELIRSA